MVFIYILATRGFLEKLPNLVTEHGTFYALITIPVDLTFLLACTCATCLTKLTSKRAYFLGGIGAYATIPTLLVDVIEKVQT